MKELILMAFLVLISSCSKDDPISSESKSDYRDIYTGQFNCKVVHYLALQGKPVERKDTITLMQITKDGGKDSALHMIALDYNELIWLWPNGTVYDYNSFEPNADSLGFIGSDSVYINYLLDASIGGREWLEINGKKR